MSTLFRRRWLILLATVPAGFVVVSIASALVFTSSAHTIIEEPPPDLANLLADVSFPAADGTNLRGWFGRVGDGRRGVILLHGYRGNRSHMTERARFLMAHGYSVLLYDARGCGESDGDLVSVGYHETADLLAAVELMRAKGVESIACLGVSQGGATILLASGRLHGIDCVIVESTYDRIENAIDRRFRHYLALPGFVGRVLMLPVAERRIEAHSSQIAPIDSLRLLQAPILVISGADDRLTTESDTRTLFAAAHEPKALWILPGAGHENLFAYAPDEYQRRVIDFLDQYMPASTLPGESAGTLGRHPRSPRERSFQTSESPVGGERE